jgi:hypothetical protein
MKKARIHRELGLLTLIDFQLAEEEGFEPPDLLQSPVFKTGAINRSTTPLCSVYQIRIAKVRQTLILANEKIKRIYSSLKSINTCLMRLRCTALAVL